MQNAGGAERWNVVVTGGDAPPWRVAEPLITNAAFVIAADAGLDTCMSWGVDPDVVVGDMDSITDTAVLKTFARDRVCGFPREKDETDTELGLRYSCERYSEHVIIVGGGGGRLDHLLGIFSLFHRETAPFAWVTDRDEVTRVEGLFRLDVPVGTTVSFFPVGSTAARMRSVGLKWELDELEWIPGDAGLSNVVMQRPVTVEMTSGRLVCVHAHVEARKDGRYEQ